MAAGGGDRGILDVARDQVERGIEQRVLDTFFFQHGGAGAAVVGAGQDVGPGRHVLGIVHAPWHAGGGGPQVAANLAVDRDPVATVIIALHADRLGAISLLDIVVPD